MVLNMQHQKGRKKEVSSEDLVGQGSLWEDHEKRQGGQSGQQSLEKVHEGRGKPFWLVVINWRE